MNILDHIKAALLSRVFRLNIADTKTKSRSIASAMSLCLVAGIATTITSFSQTVNTGSSASARVLTARDGRMTYFRLIERTADSMIATRIADGKRFVIPLSSLCDADQKFLATWTPPAVSNELRPSSVSIAGNPSLSRRGYTSRVRPMCSGGGIAGYSSITSVTGYRRTCSYVGSRTTVTSCRGTPCR